VYARRVEIKIGTNASRVVLLYIPDEDIYEIGMVAEHVQTIDVATVLRDAANKQSRTACLQYRGVMMVAEPGALAREIVETWCGAFALAQEDGQRECRINQRAGRWKPKPKAKALPTIKVP